jgi:ribosomal protein L14
MLVFADNAGVIVNPKGEMKGIICSFFCSKLRLYTWDLMVNSDYILGT